MTGFENGWKDPSKRFIPIDEISPEHLAPGFEMVHPRSPEDILLGAESEEEEDWNEWVEDQFAFGRNEEDPLYDPADPYAEQDAEEGYWVRVADMALPFETFEERGESFEDFKDEYNLPMDATKGALEKLFAREQAYRNARHGQAGTAAKDNERPPHGRRGKEAPGKHMKGGETIRRPGDSTLQ